MEEFGKLFIVSTPIGNLGDISFRSISTLKEVDLILSEDTRKFSKISKTHNINTKKLSFNEHSEKTKYENIIQKLKNGLNIALVSDAGTPTISDPGFLLVRQATKEGIKVIPIPGPSALIAALSISGFPTNSFSFEGFLPKKSGKRKAALEKSIENEQTTIFYESPYRVIKTLETINDIDPTKEIFIARELTKIYEETLKGAVSTILEELQNRSSIKGEFVLIL